MKKGTASYYMLLILTVVTVFSFYRVHSVVAMAAEENRESALEPQPESEGTPVFDTQPDQEEGADPEVEPESDKNMDSDIDQKENTASNTEPEEEPEENTTPGVWPEVEENTVFDAEAESEEDIQFDAEPQLETMPVLEPAAVLQAGPVLEPAAEAQPEQGISTGSELTAWLESHKDTGGTVKLTDHVTLDEYYSFCPNGPDGPSLFVDTDKYTITVTGEIEIISDGHLSFSGQPDGKSIFYVASNGVLSMDGITVKSERGALWQEEGAGLAVSNCSVSGHIHYADTPFVTYCSNSICAIVEKGQTINEALPLQIHCTVNRQGQLFHNEPVPVLWNLEGTEKQQEERLRFRMRGSFLNAASAEPVFCTVAYNDYPLTFTDVQASASGSWYLFRGGFTAPEESLPFTVVPEYSFDGENWFPADEQTATNTDAAFCIVCEHKQRGRAAQSNIYIRLQWNDNGTRYFSNILCYASDDLEIVEDIGGSRGGGISITSPPDQPQQSITIVFSEDDESDQPADSGTGSDNAGSKEDSSGTKQTEKGDGNPEQAVAAAGEQDAAYSDAGAGQPPDAEAPNTDQEARLHTEVLNTDKDQPSKAELSNIGQDQPLYAESDADDKAGMNQNDAGVNEKEQEASAAASLKEGSSENRSRISEQTLRTDTRQGSYIVIAVGFVLLSMIGGIAGCYVHSRSGTNR